MARFVAAWGHCEGSGSRTRRLVAEGDAVFARFTYIVTLPDGSTASARALAYYRLTGGQIVVNDVMFDPDLMPVLGPLMASPG